MDFGGTDKRRTKGDLKRKAKNRVYKRGGQFRSSNVDEIGNEEKRDKMGKVINDNDNLSKRKSKGKKNKKY